MPTEEHSHRDRCAIVGIGGDGLLPSLGAQRAVPGHPGVAGGAGRCRPHRRRRRRHHPLRHGQRPWQRPRPQSRDPRSRLPRRERPRWRRPVRDGRPGRRRHPVRPGHHGPRVPQSQRTLRRALRPVAPRGRAGRRRRHVRRVVRPLRPADPGADLRPDGPAPHGRVRHDARAARRHRRGLPGAGQRQPAGPDARPDADDGRLPRRPHDRRTAALVRLLPRDRRSVRGRRDQRRPGARTWRSRQH